ncbi:MAG: 23S rRNA (uracil(1939)-C(5))-methyltransferase RlmD [Bacteroidia bacterium]|nr:23S rRNA (uracil(1939)-C(5))-methyltransferase RlmD [Bacteroidia bacterium]MCZ2277272.1 23S rRNA (uracil(1939)-C(5))-methyltransferase RlmD [Bacteroidia bacterium]
MADENIISELEITDLNNEGSGIGRSDNRVIFVDWAVPGDIVKVEIYKKKKRISYARIIQLVRSSPARRQPFCKHFYQCGGCRLQHFDYQHQLYYKQKMVKDAFERIGNLSDFSMLPVIPSQQQRHYRNRLDFGASNRRWLTPCEIKSGKKFDESAIGFHLPRIFDKVLAIDECHLMPSLNDKIRMAVKEYALKNQLSFYDHKAHTGFLRGLIIRNSNNFEWMVIVMLGAEDSNARNALLDFIKKTFHEVTSLNYVINEKRNDSLYDLDIVCYAGSPFITAGIGNLNFRISPKSFFQTNTEQVKVLYNTVIDLAAFDGSETVYDLYCGTGTISCCAALRARKVIGLEYVKEAVTDANANAAFNQIKNTSFFHGDIKDLLNEAFFKQHGIPDVIIADPPRAGMHDSVTEAINRSEAKRIVYVSCNPSTQARDVEKLKTSYRLVQCQPIDLFPQTMHIENVALLIKN